VNTKLLAIKSLIQQGHLANAVSQLVGMVNEHAPRFQNEVILHSANLQQVLGDERKGIVGPEEARREKSRIVDALLDLIDSIDQELAAKQATESFDSSRGEMHEGIPVPRTNSRAPSTPVQRARADVLLVTVTKVETKAVLNIVKRKLSRDYRVLHINHRTYYDLGIIGGARTFMVRSEMGAGGPSGSILTVSEGITELSPSSVIMVGIAFGVDPDKQQIGDILVSKQMLPYELQRIGTGTDDELVIIPRGDRPSASPRLLDRFRDAELRWDGPKVRFGLVLSGEKLVDNLDFRNQLCKLGPEAIGGEMEGAGLYAAASLHKVDWILVKAVCDWADGKKHENKGQRQEEAARNAASFTIHVIEQGGLI
jgi:nucleoside phosphorylase